MSKKPEKKSDRICGQEFPREVIRSVMLKVDRGCVERAIEIMKHTEHIRNYERYLLSTLFNEANGKHLKSGTTSRRTHRGTLFMAAKTAVMFEGGLMRKRGRGLSTLWGRPAPDCLQTSYRGGCGDRLTVSITGR